MSEVARLYRYRQLLSGKRALSVADLMLAQQVSRATLKRDLAKLRDQLGVPVVFDRELGGYRLAVVEGQAELPGLWFNQAEAGALLTIEQLLAGLEPRLLGDRLAPLQARLRALLGREADLEVPRIKVLHALKRELPLQAFEAVAQATLGRKRLQVLHRHRETGALTERVLSPQQLIHYRDNWYVDAWCHWREAMRSFALDAMVQARVLDDPAHDVPMADFVAQAQASYGLFSGNARQWAELHVDADAAPRLRHERWHPEQTQLDLPDGGWLWRIPYTDPRELLGDLLRLGPVIRVMSPPSLKHAYVAAVQAMIQKQM